jgi:hypothetical protein
LGADNEGKAPSTRCPLVCFELRRVKLFDIDAKWGSIKDLLDGCAYAGLILGDREDQISLEVEQIKVGHHSEEKTVIIVEIPD